MRTFQHHGMVAGYGSDFPKHTTLGKLEQVAIEQAMRPLPRWYGVSTGDGNIGVSHMSPSYYVFTNDPWELAERAAKSDLKAEYHDEIEVDGEAEYVISASVYDPDMEYRSYILEVFPVEQDEISEAQADPWGKFCYGSIQEALGEM